VGLPDQPKKPAPRLFDGDKERRRMPKKQEQRVAGALGGRKTPASGALPGAKGDVVAGNTGEGWMVECKRTKNRSLSVKASWLGKVTREALKVGKTPALAIEMDMTGEVATEKDWVAIPLSEFKRLTEGE
jgi:Holliday junction resolvase